MPVFAPRLHTHKTLLIYTHGLTIVGLSVCLSLVGREHHRCLREALSLGAACAHGHDNLQDKALVPGMCSVRSVPYTQSEAPTCLARATSKARHTELPCCLACLTQDTQTATTAQSSVLPEPQCVSGKLQCKHVCVHVCVLCRVCCVPSTSCSASTNFTTYTVSMIHSQLRSRQASDACADKVSYPRLGATRQSASQRIGLRGATEAQSYPSHHLHLIHTHAHTHIYTHTRTQVRDWRPKDEGLSLVGRSGVSLTTFISYTHTHTRTHK